MTALESLMMFLYDFLTVPSQPPFDITYVSEETSVTYSWQEVPCGSRGGNIEWYTYKLSHNGETVATGNIPTPTQQVTLQRPSCGFVVFEVVALNNDGGMSDSSAVSYNVISTGRSKVKFIIC